MEILGVGPLELLFIFLIALIVLGPQDMKKAGLTMGRFMRKIVTSQGWRDFQDGWRNLRYLPNKMMREAGLDEDVESINKAMKDFQKIKPDFITDELKKDIKSLDETGKDISSWLTPPTIASPPAPTLETAQNNTKAPASETPQSDAAAPVLETSQSDVAAPALETAQNDTKAPASETPQTDSPGKAPTREADKPETASETQTPPKSPDAGSNHA